VFIDETIDGGLKIDDRSEDAARETAPSQDTKKPSTALSHEAEVGVKWKVQRG
jgi:hypothetical protein